jgi:hypothetical protein
MIKSFFRRLNTNEIPKGKLKNNGSAYSFNKPDVTNIVNK